jgi:HEAT repeat protein
VVLGASGFAAQNAGGVKTDSTATGNLSAQQVSASRSITTTAWRVVAAGLKDGKAANRIAALRALADLGPVYRGVNLASGSLKDRDADVRRQAALALGAMKARSAVPSLRAALEDKDAGVTFAAAQALWALGDRAGRNILLQVLAGQRPATDGLLDTGIREVHHRLQNPKGLVAMGAEKSAGALLGPFSFGIPVAKQILADPGSSERALTVALLAHDPDPQTLSQLKKALWDKDWTVREAGARAAGTLRRRDFIPLLAPLLEDQKAVVRYSAAVAIVRLTPGARKGTAKQTVERASMR